jgi:hypothetical protein
VWSYTFNPPYVFMAFTDTVLLFYFYSLLFLSATCFLCSFPLLQWDYYSIACIFITRITEVTVFIICRLVFAYNFKTVSIGRAPIVHIPQRFFETVADTENTCLVQPLLPFLSESNAEGGNVYKCVKAEPDLVVVILVMCNNKYYKQNVSSLPSSSALR